ncbi:MAG: DNA methyltransferase [Deltaproteobacteria bacterium]|nr:DNA methyltransferase [Deltaproteobacteria bacterium]
MIDTYIQKIASITKRGDAREESYYAALAALLEEFSETKRKKKGHVTILPKKTEAGNPDLRVWDGKHSHVGYVEAKPPRANLDEIETSDQLKRYISTFPNLILTNFYEFRLYRNGQRVSNVLLARQFIPTKLKTLPPAEHTEEFFALLEKFFQFSLPSKFTAETLAKELATRTRFLRDQIIKEELREASTSAAKKILGFYEAFQKHLIFNLKPDEFADLYAQTITYGLFAARTRANGTFNRILAYDLIPKTIGILRDIFHFISFDPPEQLQATVDDIAEVLAVADVRNILHQYFREGKGSDPIFHFYETFLAEYNPKERERRGVYYTPEPVVSYIVRSLNIILKEKFARQDGFATQSVTVLDPAGGTLTFLAEAAKLAVEEFVSKYGEGSKAKFIEDHILKHFFAFELMMAPYAAGHLKMGYLLEELGHKLSGDERFQFYLTNTLEMEELAQTSLPGMASLSEESHLAARVKKERPILVILGNPPYSGHSANKGDWIKEQIESYKRVDGKPLGEKNPKWLQDDYVKFIRFAQWKIDQIGEGVLGFITNHSYLDNPTFRGMRQSLMDSFDEIYILDLHGNSLKKEKAPDGSKDENVFDIQQGVAIALFVKRKGAHPRRIKHSEIWGLRNDKYQWLLRHDLRMKGWTEIKPSSPFYLFVPRDERLSRRFQSYPSIPEIFPVNSVGIVTARDHLTIHFTSHQVWTTVLNFVSLEPEIARHAYQLGDDARDWKVNLAQEDLKKSGPSKENIVPILYRPFDIRYTYYTGNSKGFHCMPRGEVMRHMLQPNLALLTHRREEIQIPYTHFLVTNLISEHGVLSSKTTNYQFPLYLYNKEADSGVPSRRTGVSRYQTMFVFEPAAAYSVQHPNISPDLFKSLSSAYKRQPSPEQIFYYIYAVLYSNVYREKYAEFLKTDFPRVPFTRDYKLFNKLTKKGEKLVELHLLKSEKLIKPIAKCEGSGNLRVEKVSYDQKNEQVHINPEKWFTGIPPEVWKYHIGGYQVAEKWLKDRKGRILSSEEVSHYTRVVTAIAETISIQKSLDDLFTEVETTLLEVKL